MRVLEVNVCVLLVAFSVIHAQGSVRPKVATDAAAATAVSAKYGKFLDHAEPGKDSNSKFLLDLMKERFDLSMKYLLTSKQYGSQYVQRPGMAKYLDEASSHQWEEGMDLLKKFLQRGGSTLDGNFKSAFKVEGNPQLALSSSEVISTKYVSTLKDMLEDSKNVAKTMNHLHHLGGKIYENGGDAEIAHYFDSKLEKEAELSREVAGHVNTLQKMRGLGVALEMFDSNL